MPLPLSRVLVVGPRSGAGGPGDFTTDLVEAVGPDVVDLVEVRHGPPGEETWRSVRSLLAAVSAAVRPGTVAHVELSGGSIVSFWALRRLRAAGVPTTATVHDPPGLAWWPWRVRGLARRRWLNHGVHLTLRPVTRVLERRALRGTTVLVLSETGARALRSAAPGADVRTTFLPVPAPVDLPEPSARPRAVGLFGHVYRGKGFDQLAALRRDLPADVAIRVAGRGTESLEPVDGVEVAGTLDDAALADWFASVRLLVLPYGRRTRAGLEPHAVPASGVHATALAHGTPVVSTGYGALAESLGEGAVHTGDLVRTARDLLDDPARLDALGAEARAAAGRRGGRAFAAPYVEAWGDRS